MVIDEKMCDKHLNNSKTFSDMVYLESIIEFVFSVKGDVQTAIAERFED